MASRLMVWAAIGKPNQREWLPEPGGYAKDDGLYPSGLLPVPGQSEQPRAAMQETKRPAAANGTSLPVRAGIL